MLRHFVLFLFLLLHATSVQAVSVKHPRSFMHDGMERTYYLNVPADLPPNSPLIVALHGMGGQAHRMRFGLGLHDLAFEKGFAALFPQGATFGNRTTYWNAGEGPGNHDDLGFLIALIDDVVRTHGLDPHRVYVLGISNGAQMAYHLACQASEHISGIGAVIGTITASDWAQCPLAEPVSLIHVHGALDTVMNYDGGISWNSDHPYPSVPDAFGFWAKALNAEPVIPSNGPPNTQVTRFENQDGAVAALITIKDFGHDWPNPENVGFSTSVLVADFFLSLPGK